MQVAIGTPGVLERSGIGRRRGCCRPTASVILGFNVYVVQDTPRRGAKTSPITCRSARSSASPASRTLNDWYASPFGKLRIGLDTRSSVQGRLPWRPSQLVHLHPLDAPSTRRPTSNTAFQPLSARASSGQPLHRFPGADRFGFATCAPKAAASVHIASPGSGQGARRSGRAHLSAPADQRVRGGLDPPTRGELMATRSDGPSSPRRDQARPGGGGRRRLLLIGREATSPTPRSSTRSRPQAGWASG